MSDNNSGNIEIRLDVGPDRFELQRGDRVVSIAAKDVAEIADVPREKLRMLDVRRYADILMEFPNRLGGRIEQCAELFDIDRTGSPPPMCGRHLERMTLENEGGTLDWVCKKCEKEENERGGGSPGGAQGSQADGNEGENWRGETGG